MAVAASDLIGDLIAQTPQGKVLQSKFKGLADIALAQAKTGGLHVRRHPLHARDEQRRERQRRQPRLRRPRRLRRRRRAWRRRRGGRGGGGRGGGGFGGLAEAASRQSATVARPASACASSTAASGASPAARSSPRTRSSASPCMATEVAKASAIAKRADVKLAPVPAYQEYWATPIKKDPGDGSAGREAGARPEGRRPRRQDEGGHERQRLGAARARVEVLRQRARAPTSSRRPGRRRRSSP